MITDHPGPWQHFSLRSDNRGLSTMELKSKYINEQYLFEAQMAQIQHQHNIFMNGGGGGPLSTSTTPPVVITDADALAFIAATGITDTTQKSAINSLVVSLKGYSIWNKLDVIYPFVGGTAFTHKFNLKNPADSNLTNRLEFFNAWTHNSNGITGNGTNTVANTFFNPSVIRSFGVYVRTATNGTPAFLGATVRSDSGEGFYNGPYGIDFRGAETLFVNTNSIPNGNPPFTRGYITVNTLDGSSKAIKVYRDGTYIDTAHTPGIWPSTLFLNTPQIAIGATRADYYDANGDYENTLYENNTTANIAFAFLGNTILTATEAANLNTAMVVYQTTLGRQV